MDAGNVYAGARVSSSEGIEVFRNGKPFSMEKSLAVRKHSPDGPNWGYCGSGPAQLALALLLDALGSKRAAEIWYQQFKAQVVASWGSAWVITQEDILRWHQNAIPQQVCRKEELSNEACQNPDRSATGMCAPTESANGGE